MSGSVNSGTTEIVAPGTTDSGTIVNSGGELDVFGTPFAAGDAVGAVVNSGGFLYLNGGTASGTIVNAGGLETVSRGVDSGAVVSGGGDLTVSSGGAVSGAVLSGGQENLFSGGAAVGTTVVKGGVETVYSGGLANGTQLDGGGVEIVASGGTVIDLTVSGSSAASIDAGAIVSGGISFAGMGGALLIDGAVMPPATIGGFVAGDGIDLTAVTATDAVFSGDALSLTSGGTTVAVLTLAGSYESNAFAVTGDGSGGSLIALATGAGGNEQPLLATPTATQSWTTGQHVTFAVPSGSFVEPNGQALTYSATAGNGAALPTWLSFDAATATFSGTVPTGVATVSLKVTATNAGALSVSEVFQVIVPSGGTAVNAGQPVSGTIVGSGDYVAVFSGGIADGITVGSGGALVISAGGIANLAAIESGGTETIWNGGVASGSQLNSGGVGFVASGGSTFGTAVNFGGTETVSAGGMVTDSVVNSGAAETISGIADGSTVNSGGLLDLYAGTASGTVVNNGGNAYFFGGIATGTIVQSGGTVTLNAGTVVKGGITFAGSGGELVISGQMATAPLVNGFFATTDTIDLANIAADAAVFSAGILTVTSGGATVASLTLAGSFASNGFTVGSDGQGGSVIKLLDSPILLAQTVAPTWLEGRAVALTLPAGSFTDPGGEALAYSATLIGGAALPSWLTFDSATQNFSGVAPDLAQTLSIEITARNAGGLSLSETVSAQITTANVASFIVTENADGRGANGISTFVANAPGNATTDGVVGFQSETFAGGSDAVVLDGPRTQYLVQVASNGSTEIIDTSDQQSVTVTGASYVVFDGAADHTANGAPVYNEIYLLLGSADAQIAEIYAAALAREPDLSGLEYWEHVFQSGQLDMNGIAYQFVNSPEFATLFPAAAAAPDDGGPHDIAFVTQMYETVLNRAPDAAGLAYWVGELASGTVTRWEMLADFALSTENVLNIEAVSSSSGWLINAAASGGYADSGVQETAQTVLTAAATSNFVNANLIDATGLATTTVGGVTVTATDTLSDSNNGAVIILSAAIHSVTITGSGDAIVGPTTGNAVITDNGSGSTNIRLSGTGNVVNSGPNDSITGYVAGQDHLSSSTTIPDLFTPTTAVPLNGHTLTGSQPNIVLIGAIGGTGMTADIAAAANAVFTPAAVAGETVTFYGQLGNDTVIEHWVNPVTPTATVTAGELTAGVTLIGITASTLTVADFHS